MLDLMIAYYHNTILIPLKYSLKWGWIFALLSDAETKDIGNAG